MKRILIITLALISSAANADLLLEPYIGYSIGSGEDGDSPKVEYEQNAPFLGARAGFQMLGFMAGLDYTKGFEADFEAKAAGTTASIDADQQTFGLFVGYNLPIMLRAWAAYYFNSSVEYQSGSSVGDKLKGKGFGLGVGFTVLPLLSLNLEYRMLTFDEYDNASTGNTTTLSGVDEIDYNQIMLSVSAPLTF